MTQSRKKSNGLDKPNLTKIELYTLHIAAQLVQSRWSVQTTLPDHLRNDGAIMEYAQKLAKKLHEVMENEN